MDTAPLFETGAARRAGYRDITATALAAARGTVRIVDVREPDELTGDLGHIPGVDPVPLGTLAAQAARWDRNTDIVLVCRSGGRSARAAEVLVAAGFRRVMNLAGGMLAYRAAGF